MRVAVYSICKNEEKFVERWYNSCKDADYFLLADTGSTDNTVQIANSLGINVVRIHVDPWRFDDARNASLALLPPDIDYCIPLDLDEVLAPNWRVGLEREFLKGITRPRYKFVWSWKDEEPDVQFYGDKIHARKGFRWKHPVHEVVASTGIPQIESFSDDIEIHHFPDPEKSRGQYLPLLKLSVEEDPNDDRNAFYYARELYFYGKREEALKEFKRFLSLSVWDAERAAAWRFMSKCVDDFHKAEQYLYSSLKEVERRETYLDLALLYYNRQDWEKCLLSVTKLLEITERPMDYISESEPWGPLPYDIGAVAAYHTGDIELSKQYTLAALIHNPGDERLLANYEFLGGKYEDSSLRDSQE